MTNELVKKKAVNIQVCTVQMTPEFLDNILGSRFDCTEHFILY